MTTYFNVTGPTGYNYFIANNSNLLFGWQNISNSSGEQFEFNGTLGVDNSTLGDIFLVNITTGFIGIDTGSPQNALNVLGNGNITGTLYANGSNLSIGYQYATNGSLASNNSATFYATTLFSNSQNVSTANNYLINGSLVPNNSASFYATTLYGNSQNLSTANNYLINGSLVPNNSATYYVTNIIWDAGQNLSLGYQYSTNGTLFDQLMEQILLDF